MLTNDVKMALRHARRRKGYTFINVAGLAVGMTCCLFLLLYVYDELSYDRSYERADRVFRVVTDVVAEGGAVDPSAYSFSALGPAMLQAMPQVEAMSRINVSGASSLVRVGDKHFSQERILAADSSFFDLFSYRFLHGAPETALNRPYTVVLTRSTARRYFGEAYPVGRTINLSNGDDLEVTAVIEDPPANTHIHFDALSAFETFNARRPGRFDNDWRVLYGYTYVLLSNAAHADAVEAGLSVLTRPHLQITSERWGGSFRFKLQPLTSIHLRSHRDHELAPGGHVVYVSLLAAIAVLILLIACVNFVSLTTAQATERAREVGVRKSVGASRGQLIRQFLTESTLLAALAAVLALGLVTLLIPVFNQLSGKNFMAGVLNHAVVAAGVLAVVLMTGGVAGSYSAFVLSAFRPALVLKGRKQPGRSGALVRKGLVVAQVAGAVVLMIGALVIHRQLTYMKHAELGFEKAQVVVLQERFAGSRASQMDAIKQELLRGPAVEGVTLASEWPTRPAEGTIAFRAEGMPVGGGLPMAWYQIDADYLDVLGMELLAGRTFSPAMASDSAALLINQEAAQRFGLDEGEAVGTHILAPGSNEAWGAIIGVVKDFHTGSLRNAVEPIVFAYAWARPRYILVKVDGRDVPDALAHIEATWARHMPENPLQYTFLDQDYEALYRAEERLSRVVNAFTGLAILVACLGLFGLAAYAAEQRTKEVGIRRVLGASVSSIVALLVKDFLKLVGIACVVAAPLAYVAMTRWLEDFTYRIEISATIFLMVGLVALLIAFLTVSYQAIKAALTDPVKLLRYE